MDKKEVYQKLIDFLPDDAVSVEFDFYDYDDCDEYRVLDENGEDTAVNDAELWNIVEKYISWVFENSEHASDDEGGCFGTITMDLDHFVTKLESTQRVTEVCVENEDIF